MIVPDGLKLPGLKLPGMGGLSLGSRVTDWGYAAGWLTVRAMPEFAARNVFDAGALYASRNGGPDQLRKNLARVIGVAPKDVPGSLMRASLASYARYWREAFRLPAMDHHAIGQQLAETVAGQEHVDAALANGRGVVAALPHSGNWDMAGVWMAQTYGRFTTVAERLKPESLYLRFVEYRESLGFEVIPLSGGELPPFPLPWALPVAMWFLTAASMITCAQRLHTVRHSTGAGDPLPPPGKPGHVDPGTGAP